MPVSLNKYHNWEQFSEYALPILNKEKDTDKKLFEIEEWKKSFTILEKANQRGNRKSGFREIIFHLDKLLKSMVEKETQLSETKEQPVEFKKLKWLGTPSILGFIFKELAEKGYIERPKTKGSESNGKYAEALLHFFDHETSKDNLERELGNGTSLSTKTEEKFKIPPISEIK